MITITERKTTLTINEGRNAVEIKPTVQRVVISSIGKQGPPGSGGGGSAFQNVFIQDTQPDVDIPYVWFDTTGGNIQVWVEDGT